MPKKSAQKTPSKGKNDKSLKGGLARTRRADRPATGPQFNGTVRRINSRLSWPSDDSITMHVRVTRNAQSVGSAIGAQAIALDPTSITTTGYTSLGAISPLVLAMSTAYSRFMVSNCMIKATLTTPVTNGGYIGLGYTPDNSNVSGQPSNIQDATSAVHSDMAQVGTSATIDFDASEYFVDWRPTKTSGATAPDNQCGVVQWYANAGSSADCSVIYEVDCYIHFAGFRYNP